MNPGDDASADQELIFGRHPVLEALKAGEAVSAVLLADGVERRGTMADLLAEARRRGVAVTNAARSELDRLASRHATGGRPAPNHQGVIAFAPPFAYADLDTALALALKRGEPPWVLVLDSVQDVHNLGSLLRTAEAVGVHGVLLAARGGGGITPAVRKASAGAIGYLPVIRDDLPAALDRLRHRGVAVVGLDGDSDALYSAPEVPLAAPVAVVVGGEGAGLSHAVRRRCSHLVRLPMRGHVASLNAAVAGSIVLYEVLRRRMEA